jgi:TRAP-type mannitol/chloroaromatic compound transport system permease large subunit
LLYGLIGYFVDMFSLIEFFNFLPRIWGQAAENLVLVSVPAFVFMGVMMERSGVASDLLYCVQVLLKKVPGSLALAVTIMGTVLAAMTGIIGASVTMALALPTMIRQGYSHSLSCGTIAASGTLGILIPPSIMLIIMADLLAVSVGSVFMAAIVPGLCLAALYLIYVAIYARVRPEVAPPLPPELLEVPRKEYPGLIFKSFLPPVLHGRRNAERGRRGRRLRRDAVGAVQPPPYREDGARGVSHLGAHRRHDLFHHRQRHLFRLRLPLPGWRRHRRASYI